MTLLIFGSQGTSGEHCSGLDSITPCANPSTVNPGVMDAKEKDNNINMILYL